MGDEDAQAGVIATAPEPPFDDAAKARAQEMFKDACAGCHGPTGRGDGAEQQFDDRGFPTRPRDLTLGVYKGDPKPANLYRRIVAGMPGTPMPMSDWAHGDDAWHLVHLVRSLSSDAQRERVEMKKFTIVAAPGRRAAEPPRQRHLEQQRAGESPPDATLVARCAAGGADRPRPA